MGSDAEPEYAPARNVAIASRRLASIDEAHEQLGFEASVDLHEGFVGLVEWWHGERESSDAGS